MAKEEKLIPDTPKIYHKLHQDRLASVLNDGLLYSDSSIAKRAAPGTMIGLSNIKKRRLDENTLECYPDLYVGNCVPFYFCPRSVMLYLIYVGNSELEFRGGQRPIVHLQADVQKTIEWASNHKKRWAFTFSNAGSRYFQDSNNIADLSQLRWDSVHANNWAGEHKEGKQAEFLVEDAFPWSLIERVGVYGEQEARAVSKILGNRASVPALEIRRDWYY